MYLPRQYAETDPAILHSLIQAHPLGTWVTPSDDGLLANHIPFLLDPSRGPHGTLIAHVARANPVWRSFSTEAESIVVFQGVETYITPSWYASKREDGRTVPTWNYAVVHAHGIPRAIEDTGWLRHHVSRLTDVHEAGRPEPWKVTDAAPDYIEKLLLAIVGIEIPVGRLVGKWKVSQNRTEPDRRGVIAGLVAQGDAESLAMAELVRRRLEGAGPG